MEKIEKFNEIVKRYQVPLMAAWAIYFGWTGDFGWTIEAVDRGMTKADAFVVQAATYPSVFMIAVGIFLSWASYRLWERFKSQPARDSAIAD